MDNEEFQLENIEESFALLGLALVTQEVPLARPSSMIIDHQIIGINWLSEQEDILAGCEHLVDAYGTGKMCV